MLTTTSICRSLRYREFNTAGSLSVHINSNKEGDGGRNDFWMDYAVNWCILRYVIRA